MFIKSLLVHVIIFIRIYSSVQQCLNAGTRTVCKSFKYLQNATCASSLSIGPTSDKTFLTKLHLFSCPNITYLKLSNTINGYELDVFETLPNLQNLVLEYNDLDVVKAEWFQHAQNLISIHFINNTIVSIEKGSFENLKNLHQIRFKEENLTAISHGIFSGLSIGILSLSECQISVIEDDAFARMKNLTRLNLDHNMLKSFFAPDVLTDSPNLDILWLHYNQLTQLSRVMFEDLTKLRVLNVANNKISTIEAHTFADKFNLEILLLSGNWLTKLDANLFPMRRDINLKVLYLDNNRLTYLKSDFLHRLDGLQKIVLGGNPWQCGCLDIILEWITRNNISNKCDEKYLNGERPICIVTNGDRTLCVHEADSSFYAKYSTRIDLYPQSEFCWQ